MGLSIHGLIPSICNIPLSSIHQIQSWCKICFSTSRHTTFHSPFSATPSLYQRIRHALVVFERTINLVSAKITLLFSIHQLSTHTIPILVVTYDSSQLHRYHSPPSQTIVKTLENAEHELVWLSTRATFKMRETCSTCCWQCFAYLFDRTKIFILQPGC